MIWMELRGCQMRLHMFASTPLPFFSPSPFVSTFAQAFLDNAAQLLMTPSFDHGGGEVLVALCRGQSGVEASDARAYKVRWR